MSDFSSDEDYHDPNTGELLPPVSERAINAAISVNTATPNAQLNAALMAAFSKMPVWITTDKPGAHKIKYATLKAILAVVRPLLIEQGIRIRQGSDRSWPMDEGAGMKGRLVPVFTDLIHSESGQFERTTIEMPLTRLDAPAMGSLLTFGRRYTLLAALSLATDAEDDDGESSKPREITEMLKTSAALLTLQKEVDACKDATTLYEWGEKVKSLKRADKLSADEHVLLRKHYAQRLHEVLNSDEPASAVEPKKKGKAE